MPENQKCLITVENMNEVMGQCFPDERLALLSDIMEVFTVLFCENISGEDILSNGFICETHSETLKETTLGFCEI